MKNNYFFTLGLSLASFYFVQQVYCAEYDKITAELNNIATTYSEYASVIEIGKNDQDQSILGLRVENPFVQVQHKPAYLVVGAHHGNERLSASLAIQFAKDLISDITSTSPQYVNLINRVFYIVPVLNISGYNANRRTELNQKGYYIDPNRDYPDVCVHDPYYQLKSTKNIINFIEQNHIVGAVTIHGYIGTFTYPWGIYTTNPKTLDDEFFRTVSARATKYNSYRIGTHADIVYPAAGTFEDWVYYAYGVWVNLVELAYYPNLNADSKMLLTYFDLLPSERSTQHEHIGKCTQTRGPILGRP